MDYNITPTTSLANTIISNYDTNSISSNLNYDYLIKRYKKYEKTYRYKCIKINNEYLEKIEKLKRNINHNNNLIIKEYKFYKKCKSSINKIKFINRIFHNEHLDNNIHNNFNISYNLLLNDKQNDKQNDLFFNNFINSVYKINKSYLSNEYISRYSLWNINDINKSILLYKKYFLHNIEKSTNKNKVFINQIKQKELVLNNIELNINKLINEIIEFRKQKINFYKKNNNYNDILNNLFKDENIKLDKLDAFYFFDNEIIFKKLSTIKQLKLDKANVNNELKTIKTIKSYYNSNKYNNILKEIICSNEYTNIESESIYIKIKEIIENNKTEPYNYLPSPLIIKNQLLFNIFNNKLSKIFTKKLSTEINISQTKIKSYKNDIKILEVDMSIYKKELNNIKMNRKLVMNYLFYKKKLLKLEKEIIKESNNCDFLI